MKKILIAMVCLVLISCASLTAFAEEVVEPVEDTPVVEEPTNEVDWAEVQTTISGFIVEWIEPHIEEISVIITLIFFVVDSARKHKKLNKSMGVLNNNAITVANNTATNMTNALNLMETASGAVVAYDSRITTLLESYNNTLEDNKKFREEYAEMKNYLKASTEANIEFANELGELLALANIPNYKKEELGKRHAEAVKSIREAEAKAELPLDVNVEEVKENVTDEA